MSAEVDLKTKHAEIIGEREELLEQMEACREQLSVQRRRQAKEREDARSRNAALLQDLQTIEDHFGRKQLPHPNVLAMEAAGQIWPTISFYLARKSVYGQLYTSIQKNAEEISTRFWVSVEESLPSWESFLLGTGPHPSDIAGRPPRRAGQNLGTARRRGLPPRPKPAPSRSPKANGTSAP